jgi:hypothetical protein
MNTRGLNGLVSSRVADTDVGVVYDILVEQDDGSSLNYPYTEELRGSVAALQPKDVQRLQVGGITIRNGVSLLVRKAREERPDKITVNNKTWRVVTWTYTYEYTEYCGGSGTIDRGTVVAVCDEIMVGSVV